MQIVIDARCWRNRRGYGRLARELVTALAALGDARKLALVGDYEGAVFFSAHQTLRRRPRRALYAGGET